MKIEKINIYYIYNQKYYLFINIKYFFLLFYYHLKYLFILYKFIYNLNYKNNYIFNRFNLILIFFGFFNLYIKFNLYKSYFIFI